MKNSRKAPALPVLGRDLRPEQIKSKINGLLPK
jgi:hypothetical protein